MRICCLALLAVGFLAGCGSPSSDVVTATPATGGTFRNGDYQVVIPSAGLSQEAQVSLSILPQPPIQPADADFRSVGQYLVVDCGAADLQEDLQVTVPFTVTDADSTYLQLQVGNLVLPLETQVDIPRSRLTAIIPDPQVLEQTARDNGVAGFDASHVVVGPAVSSAFDERAAHASWPSWNAYLFENGAFREIVHQGVGPASPPALGSRPAVVVHGFGSDASRFRNLAQALLDAGYTSVLSFEYDTLSSVETTGPFLRQFYQAFPQQQWHHVAHSMGCLVSRQAFEGGLPPYASSNVVLVAGPHQGTPFVNTLQSRPALFNLGIDFLLSNNLLDFRNADGRPCQPSVTDSGFVQLAENSSFLATLNVNAAQSHPRESYRTLAGTSQGQLAIANFLLGIRPEDGLIPLASANSGAIGAVRSDTVRLDHIDIVDQPTGLSQIVELLK